MPATVINGETFGKVIDGLEPIPELPHSEARSTAVLLGQYLAEIGLLTSAEELELHLQMVQGAVAAGFRTLVAQAQHQGRLVARHRPRPR